MCPRYFGSLARSKFFTRYFGSLARSKISHRRTSEGDLLDYSTDFIAGRIA